MKYAKYNVSLEKIYRAIAFYSEKGYRMLDVPMIVSKEACAVTTPEGRLSLGHLGDSYVGSAEQSFIELHAQGLLPKGKHMALTPCYRDEWVLDDLHLNMFLKLELIYVGDFAQWEKGEMILDAREYFTLFGKTTIAFEKDIVDININGIEVGSYGLRRFPDGTTYVFGTGIAEPRLSCALLKGNTEG